MNEYNNYIEIKTNKGLERMSCEEFSRWACLVEILICVEKQCKNRGIKMDDVDWVKPIEFQKYIDDRFPSMLHDVQTECNLGLI
jgi:hypothetical protein